MSWAVLFITSVLFCTYCAAQYSVTQPAAQSVSPGNTATLSCTTTGFSISGHAVNWFQQKTGERPRYLLYYDSDSNKHQGDGVPVRFSGSKDISKNTGYLTIKSVSLEDDADYFCDCAAQYSVTQPASQSVSPGNTATLSCTTTGFDINRNVRWYQQKTGERPRYLLRYNSDSDKHQGDGVPDRFSGSKDNSKNTGYLTIKSVSLEDDADYFCCLGPPSGGLHTDTL